MINPSHRTDRPAERLFDPTKIDLVALSPDQTTIYLYVVSDAAWTGSDAQINSLQEKIHNYVGFAADGQLAADFPEDRDLPWQIVIDCQVGVPDPRTAPVLSQLAEPIRRYGGDLRIQSAE